MTSRTLLIAPFSPYPATFGGAIRLASVLRMLHAWTSVTLLTYADETIDATAMGTLQDLCERVELAGPAPTPTTPRWRLQLAGLASGRTFQYRAHHTERMQQRVDDLLETGDYDHVVVEMSQMAAFDLSRADRRRTVLVLDMQNIEAELLARRAEVQTSRLRRMALRVEAKRFRRVEQRACGRFDLVTVPSARERDLVAATTAAPRVEVLPNTIDTTEVVRPPHVSPALDTVVFVGACNVDANRDGVEWFVAAVLPHLRALRPDVRVRVVGHAPDDLAGRLREQGVEVTGYVDEIIPYVAGAGVAVVPLRTGGGTRLKIIEALAIGTPVVSTTVGAEGLDVVDGEHLLLADTPEGFAAAVVRALSDADLRRRVEVAGRRLATERYDWRAAGSRLRELVEGTAPSLATAELSPRE